MRAAHRANESTLNIVRFVEIISASRSFTGLAPGAIL
jgi:hypothetical protein